MTSYITIEISAREMVLNQMVGQFYLNLPSPVSQEQGIKTVDVGTTITAI